MVGKRTQTPFLCLLETVSDVRKASSYTVWRLQLVDFHIFVSIYLYWESYLGEDICLLAGVKEGISNGMQGSGEEVGTIGQMEGAATLRGVTVGAKKSQLTVHITVLLRQCPQ